MILGDEFPVTLPNGFASSAGWERKAVLRQLTTKDEIFLADDGMALEPAARTTALLERCLVRLGLGTASAESIRALTVGDREALLLTLRRMALGERMDCIFECPACSQQMDVQLNVSELLVPPTRHESQQFKIQTGRRKRPISFRLPTGEDQEQVAVVAGRDLDAAVALLRTRCLIGKPRLRNAEAMLIDTEMAALDPQAEILLDLICPSCGADSQVAFDISDHLFRELGGLADRLYRQVHVLALTYHWSEAEIMGMARQRRHKYLELLTRESEAVLV